MIVFFFTHNNSQFSVLNSTLRPHPAMDTVGTATLCFHAAALCTVLVLLIRALDQPGRTDRGREVSQGIARGHGSGRWEHWEGCHLPHPASSSTPANIYPPPDIPRGDSMAMAFPRSLGHCFDLGALHKRCGAKY